MGTNNGAGFGWDDMTIFKIGLQWARTEQWTYRFGYSYGEQPIPCIVEVMFNILAPGVIEQHATFGFTYTFANDSELDFSLMYAFENDVTGPNPFAATPQNITLTMNQMGSMVSAIPGNSNLPSLGVNPPLIPLGGALV